MFGESRNGRRRRPSSLIDLGLGLRKFNLRHFVYLFLLGEESSFYGWLGSLSICPLG